MIEVAYIFVVVFVVSTLSGGSCCVLSFCFLFLPSLFLSLSASSRRNAGAGCRPYHRDRRRLAGRHRSDRLRGRPVRLVVAVQALEPVHLAGEGAKPAGHPVAPRLRVVRAPARGMLPSDGKMKFASESIPASFKVLLQIRNRLRN